MRSLDPSWRWETKLSSAGLVYFHFGQEILASLLGVDKKDPIVAKVYEKESWKAVLRVYILPCVPTLLFLYSFSFWGT